MVAAGKTDSEVLTMLAQPCPLRPTSLTPKLKAAPRQTVAAHAGAGPVTAYKEELREAAKAVRTASKLCSVGAIQTLNQLFLSQMRMWIGLAHPSHWGSSSNSRRQDESKAELAASEVPRNETWPISGASVHGHTSCMCTRNLMQPCMPECLSLLVAGRHMHVHVPVST